VENQVEAAAGELHRFVLFEDAFILDLCDDMKLPDDAVLIVEGLKSSLQLPARDHFDANIGAYRFVLGRTVPGALCSARVETSSGSAVLFSNVDLHSFIGQALDLEEFPPLRLEIFDDIVEHLLEEEDEPIEAQTPEGEDGDWDFADTHAIREAEVDGEPGRLLTLAEIDSEEDD
jgi:hypothetical protein